jgi:hypothetical protein
MKISMVKTFLFLTLLTALATVVGVWLSAFEKEALYFVSGLVIGSSVGIFYSRLAVLPICLGAGLLFGTVIPGYSATDQALPLFLLTLIIFNGSMNCCESRIERS